jgi:hypothetical protein
MSRPRVRDADGWWVPSPGAKSRLIYGLLKHGLSTSALRWRHTSGRRPPPFPRDYALVSIRSTLRSVHLAPIIRTSEHFHVFSPQA